MYDLDLSDLQQLVKELGAPGYRAKQIWDGVYKSLWGDPQQFKVLPAHLREELGDHLEFGSLDPVQSYESRDGMTVKTLYRLRDGLAIEAVLMRYSRRRTLCISTQAGCAMGCVFCATGQMGYRRNLSSGEIVAQVLYYARQLAIHEESVTNVVLMGMGEPFHNYDATMAAIDRLNHPEGFAFGARRFTISTVGLVPAIRRFTAEKRQVNLAISLHATEDDLRSSMLPVNERYPIRELIQACRDYVETTRRRVTFEWALIRDVNDSADQAARLAKLLDGLLCHVNIIPLNPTQKYSGQGSTSERAREFHQILEQNGIPCSTRLRRGIDIHAGCGQLAVLHKP